MKSTAGSTLLLPNPEQVASNLAQVVGANLHVVEDCALTVAI